MERDVCHKPKGQGGPDYPQHNVERHWPRWIYASASMYVCPRQSICIWSCVLGGGMSQGTTCYGDQKLCTEIYQSFYKKRVILLVWPGSYNSLNKHLSFTPVRPMQDSYRERGGGRGQKLVSLALMTWLSLHWCCFQCWWCLWSGVHYLIMLPYILIAIHCKHRNYVYIGLRGWYTPMKDVRSTLTW